MPSPSRRLLFFGAAAMLYAARAPAQPAPSLGTAASFAVLGGSGVTNSGPTRVTGDVGVSPGKSITGFPPGTVVVGDIFVDDATARQAQRDSAAAYANLAARPCTQLASATPPPGVYCLGSATPATLTLKGGADAVWVFRRLGELEAVDDSSVLLRDGATSGNVFWQVDGAMTIGARSAFAGTVLARGDITLKSAAGMSGRALSLAGTVTLDTNDATFCCEPISFTPPSLPGGKAGEPYIQTIVPGGGTPPYTVSLFAGALPPGLTLTTSGALFGTPTTTGSYTFTVLAVDAHGCSGVHTYTIAICGAPNVLPQIDLPNGVVCTPYAVDPFDFIPEKSGTYRMTKKIDDCTTQDFVVAIACPALTLPPLAPLRNGAAMSESLAPAFCIPFKCGFTGLLPNGLVFDDCTLHGTPRPGDYDFCVTAVAGDSGCSAAQCYKATVSACGDTLTFIAPMRELPNGTVGMSYPAQIFVATGGTPPYKYAIAAPPAPPPGVTLASSGLLGGTPTAPGRFNFAVRATDSAGACTTAVYTIVVGPAPPPTQNVPALSPWAMLLLPFALAMAAVAAIRRSS